MQASGIRGTGLLPIGGNTAVSLRRFLTASLAMVILLAVAGVPSARQGDPPVSRMKAVRPLRSIAVKTLPAVDVEARLAEDRRAQVPGPLRFAVPHDVEVTPSADGTWEQLADGGRLWRLRIFSSGATDLNFGFTRYWLPPGATLHIVSEEGDYFEGPYIDRDNKPHGQLWTPIVPGERAVIELYVPAEATAEPQLVLSRVGAGYRDLFGRRGRDKAKAAKAGTCNRNTSSEALGGRTFERSRSGHVKGSGNAEAPNRENAR